MVIKKTDILYKRENSLLDVNTEHVFHKNQDNFLHTEKIFVGVFVCILDIFKSTMVKRKSEAWRPDASAP